MTTLAYLLVASAFLILVLFLDRGAMSRRHSSSYHLDMSEWRDLILCILECIRHSDKRIYEQVMKISSVFSECITWRHPWGEKGAEVGFRDIEVRKESSVPAARIWWQIFNTIQEMGLQHRLQHTANAFSMLQHQERVGINPDSLRSHSLLLSDS